MTREIRSNRLLCENILNRVWRYRHLVAPENGTQSAIDSYWQMAMIMQMLYGPERQHIRIFCLSMCPHQPIHRPESLRSKCLLHGDRKFRTIGILNLNSMAKRLTFCEIIMFPNKERSTGRNDAENLLNKEAIPLARALVTCGSHRSC